MFPPSGDHTSRRAPVRPLERLHLLLCPTVPGTPLIAELPTNVMPDKVVDVDGDNDWAMVTFVNADVPNGAPAAARYVELQ